MKRGPAVTARRVTRFGLLPGLFLIGSSAVAGSFQVTPMLGDVPPGQSVHAVKLRNPGSEPLTIQIDAYEWRQADNRNVTRPAEDLMVVPPIATIPPGGTQLVRFALRGEARTSEHAYRVHYREVPRRQPEGFVGISTVIKLDVPLFFAPESSERRVAWSARVAGSGSIIRVTAENQGNRFVRYSSLAVTGSNGRVLAGETGPKYVLAGARRSWDLKVDGDLPASPDAVLKVVAQGEVNRHQLTLR